MPGITGPVTHDALLVEYDCDICKAKYPDMNPNYLVLDFNDCGKQWRLGAYNRYTVWHEENHFFK